MHPKVSSSQTLLCGKINVPMSPDGRTIIIQKACTTVTQHIHASPHKVHIYLPSRNPAACKHTWIVSWHLSYGILTFAHNFHMRITNACA